MLELSCFATGRGRLKMWTLILGVVGAFLAGGAISLKSQKAHISWIIALWVLAGLSLIAAWTLTY